VTFDFGNNIFSIWCGGDKIATAATGKAWPQPVEVSVGELRQLPKRFMTKEVCVLVDSTHLGIGNNFYAMVTSETGEAAS
jgi:hypothetical protein